MLLPPLYETRLGRLHLGDALVVLGEIAAGSVDLVLTSPPFPLLTPKEYGNVVPERYLDWLMAFCRAARRVLKDTGSLVLDLGGCYVRGLPVRSLYNYAALLRLCEREGFVLTQEFFFYNTTKLPSPAEWVTVRKIRVKDAVNTVWWLAPTPWPKADVRQVLVPYAASTRQLLARGTLRERRAPSGHSRSQGFLKDNGGTIPSNVLALPTSASNSSYQKRLRELGLRAHPARFPAGLPRFFIRFLTEPSDLVLDIFAGSNTTGWVAEELDRRWLAIELRADYAVASALRFMVGWPMPAVQGALQALQASRPVGLRRLASTRPHREEVSQHG